MSEAPVDKESCPYLKFRNLKIANYKDFLLKKDTFLDTSDFSWELQGLEVLSRFWPEYVDLLNAEFNLAFSMTDQSYGGQKADTTLFRQAICVYVMGIYGIRNDSFNYHHMNKVLKIN